MNNDATKKVKDSNESLPRVLQLNKYYYPHIGGIERVVQQIAEELADRTQMVVLVSSEDKQRHEEYIRGVKLVRLPQNIKFDSMPISFSLFFETRKLTKKQDILLLHMPFPIGDLACLLSGFKGKVVLWWHSDVVRQKKLLFFYKPIMKRVLKRADAIIVATQGHIDGSLYLKPFEEKCYIIPFGVEKSIEQKADEYVILKKQHIDTYGKVEKEKISFLFVGRFSYYKGCDLLLKALVKVENAELYMVGNGNIEELKELSNKLGIKDRVHFEGKLSEENLCKHYMECDVFVLPSIARSEAFGLVQIEAMAFGKPVINTRLESGVPYVSVDGDTGLTVTPGNVDELSDAMQWMIDNREERLAMGERARNKMKNEYRIAKMTDSVLKLFRSLIEE